MENLNLYEFFDKIDCFSRFELKKFIFDKTHHLNLNMLIDLKVELFTFCLNRTHQDFKKFEYSNKEKSIYNFNQTNKSYNTKNEEYLELHEINMELEKQILNSDKIKSHEQYQTLEKIYLNTNEFYGNNDFQHLLYTIKLQIEISKYIVDVLNLSLFSNDIESLDGTTIGTKLLFLKELGIIDFLQSKPPFNTSINSIAKILSAITETDTKSIQPALNAMISDDKIVNKNNPYFNRKNVQKVEQTLINLGYNLNE